MVDSTGDLPKPDPFTLALHQIVSIRQVPPPGYAQTSNPNMMRELKPGGQILDITRPENAHQLLRAYHSANPQGFLRIAQGQFPTLDWKQFFENHDIPQSIERTHMQPGFAALTDIGLKRTVNEDCYYVSPDGKEIIIADGAGGMGSGDVASREAVNAFKSSRGNLTTRLYTADQAVRKKAQEIDGAEKMSSTAVAGVVEDTIYHIAWIGDSRCYRLQNGKLTQITEDHSLVAKLVKEKAITPDEVSNHPRRNVILRGLNSQDATPDTIDVDIKSGDIFLFCTDGLSGMMLDSQIEQILNQAKSPELATKQLIEKAKENGGSDNITAFVRCF